MIIKPTTNAELASLLDDYTSLDPHFIEIVKLLDHARLTNTKLVLEESK